MSVDKKKPHRARKPDRSDSAIQAESFGALDAIESGHLPFASLMFLRLQTLCAASILLVAGDALGQSSSPPASQAKPLPADSVSAAERTDFDLAQNYDQGGAPDQAIAAYRRFLKQYPASPLASRAQYRVAELLEARGDLSRAFDAYQTLITRYPDTPEFEKSVTKQVLIANAFLTGKKISVLGIELIPATDRAEQMFSSIIKNAPFSRNAPIAQFNLGLTYEKQGKLKEAATAYQTVLDKYPNSSIADDALYQIGYIYMRVGESGRSQDLSALVLAKETFEDFLLQFPSSEKAAQARDNLKTIGGRESGDLLEVAKFYDRYKNYRAAAIYYNDVIRRQPNSPGAATARKRVEELRSIVGEDALRTGPEKAETGEKAALRRRLQAQVEASSLADFNGPPRKDIMPDELPIVSKPRLRTDVRDVRPLPAVEPALPNQ
jgi:outer membrane protein assembly factor BamD